MPVKTINDIQVSVNYQSEGVLRPGSDILHVERDAEPYKCVKVRLKVLV